LIAAKTIRPATVHDRHRWPGKCAAVRCAFADADFFMTYCVAALTDQGIVFASDSRTNAGVDHLATYSKMTVFDAPNDRVVVLLGAGNLASTQSVISLLKLSRVK
jgi:hypothetical protein